MKLGTLISVLAIALSAMHLPAHELGSGDIYFSRGWDTDTVETGELLISIEYAKGYPEDTPHYQVVLKSKVTGIERSVAFPMEGGRMPHLTALNGADYCDREFVFVTLRYPIHRMADVRQHLFDTHAFHAQTLKYLDTVGVPFENIAPHEVGTDFGWPYITPQRYLVVCSEDGDSPGIRFRLNEEAEN